MVILQRFVMILAGLGCNGILRVRMHCSMYVPEVWHDG
jgi:hypothetical protein